MTFTIFQHAPDDKLIISFDTPIPKQIEIRKGTVLFISGWCWHPEERITHIDIRVNGNDVMCGQDNVFRPDAAVFIPTNFKETPQSSINGFWFLVPCLPESLPINHIYFSYYLGDVKQREIYLGSIEIISKSQNLAVNHRKIPILSSMLNSENSWPLIVIGLATYNPDIRDITRQITSIKMQTYPNWFCIISDDNSDIPVQNQILDLIHGDKRFFLKKNETNVGFFSNFERIIQLISPEIPFIALCDQDDYWYPYKLMRLYQGFDDNTMLVYSDMRIVNSSGSLLSSSFWNGKMRSDSLIYEILNNEITGASCMFRGELCEYLLPFPPDIGRIFHEPRVAFHDHWIGSVAIAVGELKFINEPLYEYFQHEGNVAGYTAPQTMVNQIGDKMTEIRRYGILRFFIYAHRKYFIHGIQKLCMSQIILIRNKNLIPQKRDQLIQINRLILSGARMGVFLITNFNNRKLTGDVEKMICLGYVTGKILTVLMKLPYYRRTIISSYE